MIKFHLPDFYGHYRLNETIIYLLKDMPQYFRDNISIGSVYGCFPGMYWNGGRTMNGYTDMQEVKMIINNYNDLNVPVRFTLTNCLINEHLLYDPYCNNILKEADNGKNEILVNHPLLEKYLRDRYPNFKYISSTTKCIRDIDEFNNELDKYYLTVLDYRINNDKEFHKKIKRKDKVELLINAYCHPDCNKRKEHYEFLSQCQLNGNNPSMIGGDYCNHLAHSFQESLTRDSVIKDDELYGYFVEVGFENFKIEGRTLHPIDVIDSYMYYLIKPEFRDEVRNKIVKTLWLP